MALSGAYFPFRTWPIYVSSMPTQPAAAARRLGAGPAVFPIGLGCLGMPDLYRERES